ncbi:MAG: hypothetical protein AMXMBFR84_13520 [Candidatus Hydrogenedentota bacterium]
MVQEVKLESLGEDSNDKATVAYLLVKPGEAVNEGDDLLELTTDKAVFSVSSPFNGVVAGFKVNEGDMVGVGDVLCTIDV